MGIEHMNVQNQIEINDLISEAVNNALARRHEVVDTDMNLLDLSGEEAGKIVGGQSLPIISGYICPIPPITVGLIATDPKTLTI